MKASIFFKQQKPLTAQILGGVLLVFTIWFIVSDAGSLSQLIVMPTIGLGLLGYSNTYEIAQDFINKKHFKLFGITLFSTKLPIAFPKYIVVLATKTKRSSEWGPISALGKEQQGESVSIRLINDNKHFTLYRTKSMSKATSLAKQLSALIDVEYKT